MKILRISKAALIVALLSGAQSMALEIKTTVLRVDYEELLPITRYDLKTENAGFAGAELANEDNQTTGGFLGMDFLVDYVATPAQNAPAKMQELAENGTDLIVLMANDADTPALAKIAGDNALVINATARGTALRQEQCAANLLHTAPTQAIIADGVAQFAMWKKWPRWLLIHGSNPLDHELADAYRRAAKKFGAKIVEEREFEDTGGSRRTDTGHVLVQRQIPLFTQDTEEHDVVIAADASDVFAAYLPFHMWKPSVVLGSAGLRPVTFHAANEAWGARQFQRRFEKIHSRYAQEYDYDAWLALRIIGEAVIRTNSNDAKVLRDYMLSDDFELAAFKGQKVTFRNWNGQLRQPVILTDNRITVSVSPQEGYLHQTTTLDTLGLDRQESKCDAFNQ